MNEVFLIGKIVSDIEFKFVMECKKVSVVLFKIETIQDKQIIKVNAYNEMADYIYQNSNKEDVIMLEGKLRENCVEIKNYITFLLQIFSNDIIDHLNCN